MGRRCVVENLSSSKEFIIFDAIINADKALKNFELNQQQQQQQSGQI